MDNDQTAGEVQPEEQEAQAPATEVGTDGASSQGVTESAPTSPQEFRIGDTTYTVKEAARWAEDHKRLHGEFTRSRQQIAELERETAPYKELFEIVRNDPQLRAEVQRRVNQGQSQEQAVRGATQQDPRVDQMAAEMDSWKREKAKDAFDKAHPDLTDDRRKAMSGWIDPQVDKLRALIEQGVLDYSDILNMAYNATFSDQDKARLIESGQRIKEEEIQKGRKNASLGAPSPTAATRSQKKKPHSKMTPAERQAYAEEVWNANKKKS